MRWIIVVILACAAWAHNAQGQIAEGEAQLVREVVYNELHDHQLHGYWRYWIVQWSAQQARLSDQIETADGPILRLVAAGGQPLSAEAEQEEQERLNHLLGSPEEQARDRQEYSEDERRIGRIVALLPEAFVYEFEGEEGGCYRLRFRPNPDYGARSIETRIFHAMTGELWIDARLKRLARLQGQLQENVDFGYGLLGRLFKGGWFRLQRRQVSATDWKTERLEIHMSGRALLFKTIARETSEVRGGFVPVPAGLTLAQGVSLLGSQPTQNTTMDAMAIKAAAFAANH
jgi:hypothetical protein